jgi:hypothetical protein
VDRATEGADVAMDGRTCLELSGLNGRVSKLGLEISTALPLQVNVRSFKDAECRDNVWIAGGNSHECSSPKASLGRRKGGYRQRERVVSVPRDLGEGRFGLGENPSRVLRFVR